jgi:hypothetical protein
VQRWNGKLTLRCDARSQTRAGEIAGLAAADMARPAPQMSSRPVAWRTAGWTLSHQKSQNSCHSCGMSASVKPARSSKLFQTDVGRVSSVSFRLLGVGTLNAPSRRGTRATARRRRGDRTPPADRTTP